MKYKRKDIKRLKDNLKNIKKKQKERIEKNVSDEEDDDEGLTPDILKRHNDTGTLYKSHLLKTAQARGTKRNTYEKMIDKLNNEKGE